MNKNETVMPEVRKADILEKVSCVICTGSFDFLFRAENVLSNRLIQPLEKGGVALYALDPRESSVVRCRDCGLVYLNPRRTSHYLMEINDRMHETKNYKDGDPASGVILAGEGSAELHQSRVRAVMAYKKGGRWLDIGCGSGRDLEWAQKFGFECYGVELSPVKKDYYRKKGFQVSIGTITQANFPEKHFDVISFWDVLEHLISPENELKEAYRVLDDDGLLVIKVPNLSSLFYKLDKTRWDMFHPVHLYYFNEKTLGKLLDKYGFEIIHSTSINPFSPGMLFKRLFFQGRAAVPHDNVIPSSGAKSGSKEASQKTKIVKGIAGIFKKAINFPVNWLTLGLKRGNFLIVYAKKKLPRN